MEDQALMGSVLTYFPYRPIEIAEIGSLRIGVCRTPNWHLADKTTQECLIHAAMALEGVGATFAEFNLPDGFEEAIAAFDAVSGYQISGHLITER